MNIKIVFAKCDKLETETVFVIVNVFSVIVNIDVNPIINHYRII